MKTLQHRLLDAHDHADANHIAPIPNALAGEKQTAFRHRSLATVPITPVTARIHAAGDQGGDVGLGVGILGVSVGINK